MRLLSLICIGFLSFSACSEKEQSETGVKEKPSSEKTATSKKVTAQNTDVPAIRFGEKDSVKIRAHAVDEDSDVDNGKVLLYHDNGELRVEGNKKNSMRYGVWKSYFKNGQLWSIANYINDTLHGHSVVYHPNGSLKYSGEYNKGQRVGEWKFGQKDGNVITKNLDGN